MPDKFSSTHNRISSGVSREPSVPGCIAAFSLHFAIPVACVFAFSVVAACQLIAKSDLNPATLMGTVMDTNGDTVPNATVSLVGLNETDRSVFETAEDGLFQFSHLRPAIRIRSRLQRTGLQNGHLPPSLSSRANSKSFQRSDYGSERRTQPSKSLTIQLRSRPNSSSFRKHSGFGASCQISTFLMMPMLSRSRPRENLHLR
jgi:hypothetical protein